MQLLELYSLDAAKTLVGSVRHLIEHSPENPHVRNMKIQWGSEQDVETKNPGELLRGLFSSLSSLLDLDI